MRVCVGYGWRVHCWARLPPARRAPTSPRLTRAHPSRSAAGAANVGDVPPGQLRWSVRWDDVLAFELRWSGQQQYPDRLVVHRKWVWGAPCWPCACVGREEGQQAQHSRGQAQLLLLLLTSAVRPRCRCCRAGACRGDRRRRAWRTRSSALRTRRRPARSRWWRLRCFASTTSTRCAATRSGPSATRHTAGCRPARRWTRCAVVVVVVVEGGQRELLTWAAVAASASLVPHTPPLLPRPPPPCSCRSPCPVPTLCWPGTPTPSARQSSAFGGPSLRRVRVARRRLWPKRGTGGMRQPLHPYSTPRLHMRPPLCRVQAIQRRGVAWAGAAHRTGALLPRRRGAEARR